MKLRSKIILAQAPVGAMLALMGIVCVLTMFYLGNQAKKILSENFGNVLSFQQMKEILEQTDNLSWMAMADEPELSKRLARDYISQFKDKLEEQKAIIDERDLPQIQKLEQEWAIYEKNIYQVLSMNNHKEIHAFYNSTLRGNYAEIRKILINFIGINQDQMLERSDNVDKFAAKIISIVIIVALVTFSAGSLISYFLTGYLLIPLIKLTEIVKKVGDGEMASKIEIKGDDEVAILAKEFDLMIAKLLEYHECSVGELMQEKVAAEQAFENFPYPVMLFNLSKNLTNCNQTAVKMLGIKLQEGIIEPIADVREPVKGLIQNLVDYILAGHESYTPSSVADSVIYENGDEKYFFLPWAKAIYEPGFGVVGASVVLQDITKIHLFDHVKSDMLATIVHEFRIPINSIHMAIYTCLAGAAGELSNKQQDILFAARSDCEKLQDMVKDLLDLCRIESNSANMSPISYSMVDLVNEAVDNVVNFANQLGIAIEVKIPPIMDELFIDPDRIAVVLSNLLSNAVRYSEASGTVKVMLAEEDNKIIFKVNNKGNPIPEDCKTKIFDKFFRIPGRNANDNSGAGLGLYIAREIIRAHKGEIGMESTAENGTSFWITLPSKHNHDERE